MLRHNLQVWDEILSLYTVRYLLLEQASNIIMFRKSKLILVMERVKYTFIVLLGAEGHIFHKKCSICETGSLTVAGKCLDVQAV